MSFHKCPALKEATCLLPLPHFEPNLTEKTSKVLLKCTFLSSYCNIHSKTFQGIAPLLTLRYVKLDGSDKWKVVPCNSFLYEVINLADLSKQEGLFLFAFHAEKQTL